MSSNLIVYEYDANGNLQGSSPVRKKSQKDVLGKQKKAVKSNTGM